MNAEVQKLFVSFDRYNDILNCTLRVYTVRCTKFVERESCNCTRKCRRTREMEQNYTSDSLTVDNGYAPVNTVMGTEYVHLYILICTFALVRDIMLMHHTYGV